MKRCQRLLNGLWTGFVLLAITVGLLSPSPARGESPPKMVQPATPDWKYDMDVLQGTDFSVRTPQSMDRLVCDEQGRLWAKVAFTWPDAVMRNTDQYTPRGRNGIIVSQDYGLTWKLTDEPWKFPRDHHSTLPDGTIIETGSHKWERHPHSDLKKLEAKGYRVWEHGKEQGYCAVIYDMWMRRSTNGGQTWETKSIHDQFGFFASFVTRDIQRVLDDGTIVAFCYGQRHRDDPRSAYIVRSRDRGDTWEITMIADGRLSPSPSGFTETFPLVYPDGRMFVLVRSELANFAYVVRSADGGKTWSAPEATPLRSKHVIPTLLSDGTVLVGYQRRFRPIGYRARFTSDLGKTWSDEVVIRDNFEFGDGTRWPVTIELPDGSLYTLMTGLKFGDDGEKRLYVCGSRWSRTYRRPLSPELVMPERSPVINADRAGKSPWKSSQAGALPAFPGAEGFGSTTPGGRGGQVLFVTNLADSGPGSFRAACEAEGPRIVVFRTGGTILLRKTVEIRHPFITIAGQSAPGGGICLRNVSSSEYVPLRIVTDDVVIRYLRIRPGPSDGPSPCVDALAVEHGAANVIIDHCSLSWATDETFQLWTDPHDITLQWSFVTEALHHSTHPKGPHSKGVILASRGADHVSVHHSLLAHNQDRNPRIGLSGTVDFVNNVIYNPDAMCQITDDYAKQLVNYVGNYVKPGPDSKTAPPTSAWSRYEIFARETGGFGFAIFLKDNIGPHRPDGRGEESAIVDPRDRQYVTSTRNPAPPVTTVAATNAYELVLDQAGATLPARDAVDRRIVNEVRTGNGRIIDHPSQVGGWPELAAGTPPEDSDLDGMPDAWEKAHGFNPTEASDNKLDADGDGYTNIEEYLNGTDPQSRARR